MFSFVHKVTLFIRVEALCGCRWCPATVVGSAGPSPGESCRRARVLVVIAWMNGSLHWAMPGSPPLPVPGTNSYPTANSPPPPSRNRSAALRRCILPPCLRNLHRDIQFSRFVSTRSIFYENTHTHTHMQHVENKRERKACTVCQTLCEKVNDRRAKCGHVKNAKIWQRWITVEVLNGHSKLPDDLSTIHVESESYVDRSELGGRFDILLDWKLYLSVWQFLIAFCGSLIIRSKYYIFFRTIDFCRLFLSFELLIIPKVIAVLVYLGLVLYVIRKIYWWIVIYWLN